MKPSTYMGATVDGGASGATSQITNITSKEARGMRKSVLAMLVSLTITFALVLSNNVIAGNIPACPEAPIILTCNVVGDNIEADWDIVNCLDEAPADKYSVSVEAGFDTDDDGVADEYCDFSFGTSDRMDGDPMSQSDLDIPIAELDCDVMGDEALESPIEATLRVKGLSHHTKKLKQKNAFSDECIADLSN